MFNICLYKSKENKNKKNDICMIANHIQTNNLSIRTGYVLNISSLVIISL